MTKKQDGQSPKPMGRPSTYTEDMADLICEKITEGMSLRKICMLEGFPKSSAVYVWLDRHPDFADKYARAREAATEDMLEEILEIADNTELDAQDKRVRIDTRKWAMGKLKPKKYGERQIVDVGNKEGETLKVESKEDLAAFALRMAELMRMQEKGK